MVIENNILEENFLIEYKKSKIYFMIPKERMHNKLYKSIKFFINAKISQDFFECRAVLRVESSIALIALIILKFCASKRKIWLYDHSRWIMIKLSKEDKILSSYKYLKKILKKG
ncbi:MAG: hypothetical protein QXD05_01705 [Candidatus Pacearchaeota archaeon]